MKIPAPSAWLILVLAGVALALALAGCSPPNDGLPEGSYVVHRCDRDHRSDHLRDRSAIDVYATPLGERYFKYEGSAYVTKMDPKMDPQEVCVWKQ